MVNFVVAIDGPAGSGKSSISKVIAQSLGFTHIDTGAMYRAVTLKAMQLGIDLADESEYDFLDTSKIIYKNGKTYIDDVDVSKEIRSIEVTNNVSTPSKLSRVREKMVEYQRESAKHGLILMDGRDIGTVVLPHANLKIFLTASVEKRAERRLLENESLGIKSEYETLLKEIEARDIKDSTRAISPLKKADDAVLVDTTDMGIDEVCNKIIKLIDERLQKMEDFTMDSVDFRDLRVRDKVEGTVVSVQDKTILLDINYTTEGTMHLEYYTKDKSVESFKGLVKVGDVIKCEVAKISENKHGEITVLLSRLNQLKDEAFKSVLDAKADDKDIEVTVVGEVNKGYSVNYNGVNLFMPSSQAPKDVKVGNKLVVRILEVDEARKRAVVSRRAIENEEYQDNKSKEYDSINVGDVLTGTIVKIEKYGAIVRFNLVQGLLKTNQVSHEYIDINKELTLNEKIEVKVVAKENGKLELSRKALLKTPFEVYAEAHKVGEKVTGKVVNKFPFGLLLEVSPNVKGLLHSSQYSHNPNDNFNNFVKIGDEVEVAILSIDTKEEKLALSRKALMDNPWSRVTAQVGDLVDVKVTEVKENGLVVEALGVDGFVSAIDAVVEYKNDNLGSYYSVGDTAKAYVVAINPKEWKLKLSIRKYLIEQDRKSYEKYLGDDENASTSLGDMIKNLK